eukprot:m.135379 g.135379  ORF g.135379 m.135379 type:complete len:578 (+) comp13903_c0_seq2:3155-4888(+)
MMIVAMCHFCDTHGPALVMCTQAVWGVEDEDGSGSNIPQHKLTNPSHDGASPLPTPQITADPIATEHVAHHGVGLSDRSEQRTCDACRWSAPHSGYSTHATEGSITCCSTSAPISRDDHAGVRRSCVHSLSSEVCDGDGSVLFGDTMSGYTWSYSFFLADTGARGKKRRYSIVVLDCLKEVLLNSWDLIETSVRLVADELRAQAAEVDSRRAYAEEECRVCGATLTTADQECPNGHTVSNRARSLQEVTGQDKVYERLHSHFCKLLTVYEAESTRSMQRGRYVPLVTTTDRESNISEMPPVSATLSDNHTELARIVHEGVLTGNITEAERNYIVSQHRELEKELGTPTLGLRDVYNELGPQAFARLVDSIGLGNQCIVVCADSRASQDLCKTLASLVPPSCASIEYNSPSYVEAFRTRFLALHPDTPIPMHTLDPTEYSLLRLTVFSTPGKGWEGWRFNLTHPISPSIGGTTGTFAAELCEYFQTPQPPSCDDRYVKLLTLRWVRRATLFFTWTNLHDDVSCESMEALVQALKLSLGDVGTLRFFTTALTGRPRRELLSMTAEHRSGSSSPRRDADI